MKAMTLFFATAACVLVTPISNSGEQPRAYGPPKTLTINKQGKKDHKQYCYSTFTIDERGNWTAKTKFSNGKNIDGDHFRATMVIKDKNGSDFLALSQVAGVKAAFACKGSCERNVANSGRVNITANELTENAAYECSGYNGKDDLGIAIGAVISIVCYAAGAPCTGIMP